MVVVLVVSVLVAVANIADIILNILMDAAVINVDDFIFVGPL